MKNAGSASRASDRTRHHELLNCANAPQLILREAPRRAGNQAEPQVSQPRPCSTDSARLIGRIANPARRRGSAAPAGSSTAMTWSWPSQPSVRAGPLCSNARKILASPIQNLAPGGRVLTIQSAGAEIRAWKLCRSCDRRDSVQRRLEPADRRSEERLGKETRHFVPEPAR